MSENSRRGRQARNFTTNVPKFLDLKSSSEHIFSENSRWVPLFDLLSLSPSLRFGKGLDMGKDSPNHDRTKKIKILPAKLLACWLLRQISNFQYLAQFKILPGGFFRQNFEFQDSSGKNLVGRT